MSYVFGVRDLAEQKTLATRATCTHDLIASTVGSLFAKVGAKLKEFGLKMEGPPHCVYLAWREDDCDLEAGCPVSGHGPSEGDVVESRLPGGRTLVTRHVGPYDKLHDAHMACLAYADENELTLNGAPWEVYFTDPDFEPDSSKWITEVCYPVE